MLGELMDLYDPATGQVTGTASRAQVRAQNLPHAATAVLVVDGHDRVYVHRRTDTKDVYPGMWDCWAGGVVGAGESPDHAAARELAEELGIDGVVLEPLFREWYRDDRTHYLAYGYQTLWRGALRHQPDEVAEGGSLTWVELAELLADPCRPFVPDGRVGLQRVVALRELVAGGQSS